MTDEIKKQLTDLIPLIVANIPRIVASRKGFALVAVLLAALFVPDIDGGTRLAVVFASTSIYMLSVAWEDSAQKRNG